MPHTASSWTTCASSSRSYRGDQPRPGGDLLPDRGAQLAGRPSIGSWLAYGLGSENADLPAFVVLISQGSGNPTDQPLYDRLWGSGFLPTRYQGVKFRAGGDPVLFLSNPTGSAPRRAAASSTTSPG